MVVFTSKTKLLKILDNKVLVRNPKKIPNNGPPPDNFMNYKATSPEVEDFPSTTSSMTKKTTIAVPSLRRLSPSIRVESYFEAPSSLRSDTTATGSVAEMIAP